MLPYSIPPSPQGQWIEPKTGKATRTFYRFLLNLFINLGSGQSQGSLLDAEALIETARQTNTSRSDNEISELQIIAGTMQSIRSELSRINNRLKDIETVVYGNRAVTGDIDHIRQSLADLQSIVETTRH